MNAGLKRIFVQSTYRMWCNCGHSESTVVTNRAEAEANFRKLGWAGKNEHWACPTCRGIARPDGLNVE